MRRAPMLVLVCGFLILAMTMGSRFSFGLFLQPMSQDLGWSFGILSLFMGIQAFMWGVTQPLAGIVADRFGPARTVAVGLLLYAVGLYWMATPSSPPALYLGAATVLAVGGSMAGISVILSAVARAFPPEKQSMVMGAVTAGASFGQLVFSPMAQTLIGAWGWTTALFVMAAMAASFSLLALALVTGPKSAASTAAEQKLGAAILEAGQHSGFLYLTAGFFVCGFHVTLISTHLPAFAALCGLPAMVGAVALSLIGAFNVIGTNVAGYLGGRFRKKYLLSGIYVSRSVVIAIYIALPITEATTLVFAAAMGLLWLSTVPLTSGIVSQIFGARWLATLFGLVFFGHQVGSFLGAWLGGYIYAQTGSYDGVWWIAILLGLFAGVIHLPIADRPLARLTAQPA